MLIAGNTPINTDHMEKLPKSPIVVTISIKTLQPFSDRCKFSS